MVHNKSKRLKPTKFQGLNLPKNLLGDKVNHSQNLGTKRAIKPNHIMRLYD